MTMPRGWLQLFAGMLLVQQAPNLVCNLLQKTVCLIPKHTRASTHRYAALTNEGWARDAAVLLADGIMAGWSEDQLGSFPSGLWQHPTPQ